MGSISSESEYTDKVFEGLAVRPERVSDSEFSGCSFSGCPFRETIFERCRFTKCAFNRCDLSFARLQGTSFIDTTFNDSKLIGIDWASASWGFLSSVAFVGCTLSYSIFTDLDLPRLKMSRCVVEESDFRGSNLSDADLTHTDFSGSIFRRTTLEGADFSHATNYSIDPTLNRIKGARFMLPEATALLRSLKIVLVD
jgi:fluoroquinolone resistance protein